MGASRVFFHFSSLGKGTLILMQLKEGKARRCCFHAFLSYTAEVCFLFTGHFLQGCISIIHELDGNRMWKTYKRFAEIGAGSINALVDGLLADCEISFTI